MVVNLFVSRPSKKRFPWTVGKNSGERSPNLRLKKMKYNTLLKFCFWEILPQNTRVGQIWIIICKQNKKIDLFSKTEIVTFQYNLPGVQYTCTSSPEACGCCSGRSLLVTSVATPEHPVSLPHYCETFFHPDTPLGGQRGDSRREQGPNYMEDVVERSISVSGWCPWFKQRCVDGRYPGEMTLTFEPFFSCSWWLSLLGSSRSAE